MRINHAHWRSTKALMTAALLSTLILPAYIGKAQAAEAAGNGSNRPVDSYHLRILHTNDTHAHLDNAAKRITAIKQARNDQTLLLDAGDVFSGTLYFNQYNGLADLFFMNMAGYDAMTFGNHEFDKGPAALASFIRDAKFPFVSSNIDFSRDKDLGGLYRDKTGGRGDSSGIYPAIVKDVNGEKIGIFGLTTADTASLSSPGENIRFKAYAVSAQAVIDQLQRQGVNKIVALSHLGYSEDQKLANAVKGLDIIVGGHSHTKLTEPAVIHADSEPTVIVQTGEYNQFLGQLDAAFDDKGVLKGWNGKLIELDAKDEAKKDVIAADPSAAAQLQTYAASLEELKKKVIGKTNVILDGERGNVRKKETNLGDFMADGMLNKVKSLVKAPDAKGYITIQNGGGIRASLPAGDITLGGLLTVMPYANNLTALKMTGQEIKEALENGVSGVESGEGRFPQVAGMRFYYDSTKPKEKLDSVSGQVQQQGSRIMKVQIKGENGKYSDMDPNAYYIVATNSFTAGGGDFYRSMKKAKDAGRSYELNLVDYEVFQEHLKQTGTVTAAAEGRVIDLAGAQLPADAADSSTSGGASTPVQQPAVFSDMNGHWAADAVNKASSVGVVTGYGDSRFRPDAAISRAEFAVLLSRALEQQSESQTSTEATVQQAPKDANQIPVWAQAAAAKLTAQGILKLGTDGGFRPGDPVTREELSAALAKAYGWKSEEITGLQAVFGGRSKSAGATRAEAAAAVMLGLQF
ncbi:5'-nucleotidase C-terminal domain-containing protein [Paenibacillus sp. JX-17]|uniref:5'-nucleotidase C-terminal domain-containing protein n=1 Tax=Paenibacillus lacisoli TaxID=3064525 RepID=A0ABT9CH47_9BACL|nr:5'-nucleotidase C-terminal domain-containing protein [Paenibacillus sp. JX-17]MDO7907257.1 5'-nucleotidase C-terminal domain-containing protein [Paenibacillus sp. JX-17]